MKPLDGKHFPLLLRFLLDFWKQRECWTILGVEIHFSYLTSWIFSVFLELGVTERGWRVVCNVRGRWSASNNREISPQGVT